MCTLLCWGGGFASKCSPEQSRAHLSIPTTDKMSLHTRAEEWQGSLTTSHCIEWTLDLLVSVGAALSSRGQPQRIQTEMSHGRGKGQEHRTDLISFRNLLDPLLRTLCVFKKINFSYIQNSKLLKIPPCDEKHSRQNVRTDLSFPEIKGGILKRPRLPHKGGRCLPRL